MTTSAAQAGAVGARRRLSAYLYRHRPLKLALLLAAPLGWILVVYLAALGVLLLTSLWVEDELSGRILHTFTTQNFQQLWDDPTYRSITKNTVVMAIEVTVTDAILAFPLAYYMVRIAGPKMRALLFIGVLMPLWSSYLIKAYTWRLITAQDGPINWAAGKIGLGPYHLAFTTTAMWLAFSYMWLPYMVLPVYAALERVPSNFLEASSDLGGRAWITFRKVIWPLALPGIAAGSIFTFSLTLGDYVLPDLVGGNNHEFIGNVIFAFQGVAQNLPLAAAFACVPVVIVIAYLMVMKRLGAFEAL
jgi:putative spermidine/putrescine transport system permease protein